MNRTTTAFTAAKPRVPCPRPHYDAAFYNRLSSIAGARAGTSSALPSPWASATGPCATGANPTSVRSKPRLPGRSLPEVEIENALSCSDRARVTEQREIQHNPWA